MVDTDKPSKINGFKACYVVKYGFGVGRLGAEHQKSSPEGPLSWFHQPPYALIKRSVPVRISSALRRPESSSTLMGLFTMYSR